MKLLRPRRLSARLVIPFFLLVSFLAVVGSWFLTRQTFGSLQERAIAQLADATARGEITVGEYEAELLETADGIASNRGLPEAVAAGDRAGAEAVAAAGLASSTAAQVSLLVADPASPHGLRVLTEVDRARGAEPAEWVVPEALVQSSAAHLSGVGAVRAVLDGRVDDTGDKYAALVPAGEGVPAALSLIAPLRRANPDGSESTVGAVVVSTPLATITGDLRSSLGLDAAILAPDGTILASSFGGGGPFEIAPEALGQAMTGSLAATDTSWQDGTYTVTAGPLELRDRASGVLAVALPQAPVRKTLAATRVQVLLLFAGGLAGVLLVGLIVARRIARTVNELATAADAVAAGDFDRRVPRRSEDELGLLAVAFNNMADRLSRYRAGQEDVIRRLRDVDRAKDELLDNISHELRTPLTPIKGAARLLARSDLDDATRRQMADMIAQNSDRLVEQVNRMIAASSSAARRGEPHQQRVDPVAVAYAVSSTRVGAEARERIHISVDAGVGYVAADEETISQILFDLIDNALKFSEGDVEIHASAAERPGAVLVEVRDRGIGVPESERERIFERFHQVDGSSTRRHGGLGLGLAVVADLVGWIGGEAGVRAREGGGTVAWVVLPGTGEEAVSRPATDTSLGLAVKRVAPQPR